MTFKKEMPRMKVGRYAGTPIDQLPNSYLRWMIGQNFPREWMEIAKRKLANSDYSNEYIHVSRHALDMFSLRFIWAWSKTTTDETTKPSEIGIATFVAKMAQEAWDKGADVSKHRHQNDGVVRLYEGIQWVFGVSPHFPDYKEVITVMPENESKPK